MKNKKDDLSREYLDKRFKDFKKKLKKNKKILSKVWYYKWK